MLTRFFSSRQTGVALIAVLLVVFLAAVAAAALASVQQLAIRRNTLLLHQQQARLYGLGAEQWAAVILRRDLEQSKTDHLGEDWAGLPPVLPVEGGTISGNIQDLQGRFNLNNLLSRPPPARDDAGAGDTNPQPADTINKAQFEALQRLLEILQLAPGVAQAIADWIDPDQEPRFPDGAEDSIYLSQNPPYLAANRPLLGTSELRLIQGVDPDTYATLTPYVCALPSGAPRARATPLNINTTTAPVLAALADIDLDRAETLIEDRKSNGYASVDDFLAKAELAESPLTRDNLAVSSRYFLVRIEARVGDGRTPLTSVMQRPESADGADNATRILLRSFGHDD